MELGRSGPPSLRFKLENVYRSEPDKRIYVYDCMQLMIEKLNLESKKLQ